jgi:adenylate cyclase
LLKIAKFRRVNAWIENTFIRSVGTTQSPSFFSGIFIIFISNFFSISIMEQDRQLAAILFTDIVGSTAIMQKDEQLAVSINKRYLEVLKEAVLSYSGKIVNDYGDGSLCIFASVTQSVRCAMEVQRRLQLEPKVPLRMGLHVGEIFFEDGKVFGDGVNIASRIQSLGIANSILFSSEVNSKLKNHQEFRSILMGRFQFKNVDEAVDVFALSNDGFIVPDKTKIVGKLQSGNLRKSRIIVAVVLLLVGCIAFGLYKFYFKGPGFTGKDKSIAVLPFETISSGKESESISDGFTTDIINKLSKLTGLTDVPGWARVKMYKNSKENILDIAKEIGVAAILTGTFQKENDRLHIIAALTDVNTGKTIWHTDDDRKWGDVLTLQNEVAEKIARSLSVQLTVADQNGIKKQYTENTDAYYFYNKGRYFWDKRIPEFADSAEANYQKAIEIDPNYALAYAGLADLFTFNIRGLSQLESVPLARDYAEKALRIDSNLAEAITTMGFIQSVYDYDWKKSKLTLERAIKLDPSYAYAHVFYGNLLLLTGQNMEGGIEEIKRARDLDPTSVPISWALGRNLYFAGENDLAEQQLRKTIIMGPNFTLAKVYLAYVLLAGRRFTEAIDLIQQVPKTGISLTNQYRDPNLVYAYGVSGNMPEAKAAFKRALDSNTFKLHYDKAAAYVALKENALAFAELDRAISSKEIFVYFIRVDPLFAPLHNLPEFKMLLKRVNLE